MNTVAEIPEDLKKIVLVVDDAPSNIRAVNEILHDSYRVRVATNGANALKLAVGSPAPDLILLDIVMPGIGAYEVRARLKENPATRDIPVICLTGQTDGTEESKGFAGSTGLPQRRHIDASTAPGRPCATRVLDIRRCSSSVIPRGTRGPFCKPDAFSECSLKPRIRQCKSRSIAGIGSCSKRTASPSR